MLAGIPGAGIARSAAPSPLPAPLSPSHPLLSCSRDSPPFQPPPPLPPLPAPPSLPPTHLHKEQAAADAGLTRWIQRPDAHNAHNVPEGQGRVAEGAGLLFERASHAEHIDESDVHSDADQRLMLLLHDIYHGGSVCVTTN